MKNHQQWLQQLQSDGVNLDMTELLRYRQLTQLINLKPGKQLHAAMSGMYLSKHKGRGMEFDEARHYQPGDDIRAIDWRVTARTGKTHTKIYREERERPVFVLCDLSRPMRFGTQLLLKSVQAAHLTSLISWAAVQRGDKTGALIFSDTLHRECKPQSRKQSVLSICHQLIQISQTQSSATPSAQAFEDSCARARRLARPGSLVYVISDFSQLSATACQHLTTLSRHCEVKALMITDPLEQALPDVPNQRRVQVTDGIHRQSWLLGSQQQQMQYQHFREQQSQHIKNALQLAGISLQLISAGQALDEQLNSQGFRSQ
ncbi:DUF58 domain-containing protein [Salinimonas lutimaris]|uniref:DUF58 domain-containing protein n=1 Tax=Salinimonas lutimaris TaxID=914153 RepID=UPI0010C093D7|nr:DUF58 domain-containing protein [Salinimonas lutimaris]